MSTRTPYSMGAAFALLVAHECKRRGGDPAISGLVLSAPMCGIDKSKKPSPFVLPILQYLAYVVPSLAVIASNASDAAAQYRDPAACRQCEEDPYSYSGKMRLGTGACIMAMMDEVERAAPQCDTPLLVCQARPTFSPHTSTQKYSRVNNPIRGY